VKPFALLIFFATAVLGGQTAVPATDATATQNQIIVLNTSQAQTLSPEQRQRLNDAAKQLQLRMQRLAAGSQEGCPVVLTSTNLSPYMMLLRAGGGNGTYDPVAQGGVDLEFRNASGKEIRSMQLQAEFLAKKSIYDLQTEKITMLLTVYGTGDADATVEHSRHLALQSSNHPVALNRVTLKQVVFDDGSMWAARQDNACGTAPNSLLRVMQ
jgi:hypothetical protein